MSIVLGTADSLVGTTAEGFPSFTLYNRRVETTSVGVYKNNKLIQTLLSNSKRSPGFENITWDGRSNEGKIMPAGEYDLIREDNDISHQWEGAHIGNTSTDKTGAFKHRSFLFMNKFIIVGSYGYYSTGYAESTPSIFKINLNGDIQKRIYVISGNGTDQSTRFMWSDGNILYSAGNDPGSANSGSTYFIYGINAGVTDSLVTGFSAGSSLKMTHGRTYASVIDKTTTAAQAYTGFTGNDNYLFAARGGTNEIRVLNKYPLGSLVHTITGFANPRHLCCFNNFIWIAYDVNSVGKFKVDSDGSINAVPLLSLQGLVNPVYIAVSPDGTEVTVLDGGSSQQVKSFSSATGALLKVFGDEGGYANNTLVKDHKFLFGTSATFFTHGQDGKRYIGDVGNDRMQIYDQNYNLIDRVMFSRRSYNCRVDKNNPETVFSGYFEYKINYNQPLTGKTGWELVRNFSQGASATFNEPFQIFSSVVTLSNGKRYAFLKESTGALRWQLVLLPTDGSHIVFTGQFYSSANKVLINPDGSIVRTTRGVVGGTFTGYKKDLTGFDVNDYPIYGPETVLFNIANVDVSDPSDFGGGGFQGQITDSGKIVTFDRNGDSEGAGRGLGAHLGFIDRNNSTEFECKTSFAILDQYTGDFPTDDRFPTGLGVNDGSAGGNVYVCGNTTVYNYQGEGYAGSQVNIWRGFSDIGLMLFQLGILKGEATEQAGEYVAGNVFSGGLARVGHDLYIYHCDESTHSGIHRIKVSNIDSVVRSKYKITLNIGNQGLRGKYYNGPDLDSTRKIKYQVDPVLNLSGLMVNSSVSWRGFIKSNFRETYTVYITANAGVRLWLKPLRLVDTTSFVPLIDQWSNISANTFTATILLDPAIRNEIRLDTNATEIKLEWSSANTPKQIIPATALNPGRTDDSRGINLLENWEDKSRVDENIYGWTRTRLADSTTGKWLVRLWRKSYTTVDMFAEFNEPGQADELVRNLELPGFPIKAWKIDMEVNLSETSFNNTTGAQGIQVLDSAGLVIFRLFTKADSAGTKKIFLNNNVLLIDVTNNFSFIEQWLSLSIFATAAGIKVSYAGYHQFVPIQNASAVWNQPKQLKFYFSATSSNENKKIAIREAYYNRYAFVPRSFVMPLPGGKKLAWRKVTQ